MNNYIQYRKVLLPIIVIILTSISCNLPFLTAQPEDIDDINPAQSEATSPLVQETPQDILGNPNSKEQISYQATEAELTRLVADALILRSDVGISNPAVYLRNGIIEITGEFERSGIKMPIVLKFRLFADEHSRLQYEIISAKLGPLPLPDYLLEQLSSYIEDLISDNLNLDKEDIIIEQIVVDNGIISIRGYLR